MERSRLICSLVGFYCAKFPNSTAKDLQILIDNHLLECHLTPLGQEDGDLEILSDLVDESFFSVLFWSNRTIRREGAKIMRKQES